MVLASALAQRPEVLLLDEPTNDLDVDTLRALEDALLDFAGCVMPEDIARSVRFVLEQPNDVVITQIVVVPTRRTPDSSAA